MDHLHTLRDPTAADTRVPYVLVSRFRYDGEGIAKFLHRIPGLDLTEAKNMDIIHATGLFQSWLYFGTLSDLCAIYDIPFSIADFVNDDVVTSERLEWYLAAWIVAEKKDHGNCLPDETEDQTSMTNPQRLLELRHLRYCAEREARGARAIRVRQLLGSLSGLMRTAKSLFRISRQVWDSTVLLGVCLENAATRIFRCQNIDFANFVHFNEMEFFTQTDRFEDSRWCVRNWWIAKGLFDCDAALLYVASGLDQQSEARRHIKCSRETCTAYQVDEATYVTRHCLDCRECLRLGSDALHLEQVFVKTCTPSWWKPIKIQSLAVMALVNDEVVYSSVNLSRAVSSDTLLYMPIGSWNRFVAFSHVWADGLGNPKSNSLPLCQLRRLQDLANAQFPSNVWPVPFWIDSMCIPLEKIMRRKVIEKMCVIYRAAVYIIVLDQTLQRTKSQNMGPVELGLRIIFCGWSRRLWTLQEGAMLGSVRFIFEDGVIQYDTIRRGLWESCSVSSAIARIPAQHPLSIYIEAALPQDGSGNSSCVASPNLSRYVEFAFSSVCLRIDEYFESRTIRIEEAMVPEELSKSIFHNIAFRNLTKAADESLVVATMFSARSFFSTASPARVAREEPAERYRTLLKSIRKLPQSIIFLDQPRYSEYGSRWIPRSLLHASSVALPMRRYTSSEGPIKSSNEQGIWIDLPAFDIHSPEAGLPPMFIFALFEGASNVHIRYLAKLSEPGSPSPLEHNVAGRLAMITEATIWAAPQMLFGVLVSYVDPARSHFHPNRTAEDRSCFDMSFGEHFKGIPVRHEALVVLKRFDESQLEQVGLDDYVRTVSKTWKFRVG